MNKPVKVLLSVFLCLTCGLLYAQTQNKKEPLGPNASLHETLDWLKTHIPYSYVAPVAKDRRVLERHQISQLQTKGCTLAYEVSTETMEPGTLTSSDRTGNSLNEQDWQINLKGLNPKTIRVEPPKGERPARIVFSSFSFDPKDPELRSKIDSGQPYVAAVVPNKTIWHKDRMNGLSVRNGEGFVSWGSFFVLDESKGQEIAAALKHAIVLCQ